MSHPTVFDVSDRRGARWIRAALQVNPYGYVGQNPPSSRFNDEASYNTALLDACDSLGIEIIGITDHWCADTAVGLIADAEARGVTALPGFEASSSEGYHLLILFNSGTELATVNAAIGACGVAPGCDNGTTGKAFAEILTFMGSFEALVIPAHSNVANSGMLTGRRGAPLERDIKNPDLHALAISPNESQAQDQQAVISNRNPFVRDHALAILHSDDICDPGTLAQAGGSTWFKMSRAGLDGIKHAVRTPKTRVSLTDPTSKPRILFQSIAWTGGFLNGVKVSLADDLTAFIGGRGTGKSTVIESLRYALGISPIGEAAARDHASIVSGVIENGTIIDIEVVVATPAAGRFTIQRTVPNSPIVLDASGSVTDLTPFDVVGDIEIFGQHELAEVAQQPTSVAMMIQRFSGQTNSGAIKNIQQRLSVNRSRLQNVEEDQERLEETLADISRLEAAMEQYKNAEWAKQLDEQQRLSQDAVIFSQGADRVELVAEEVQSFLAEGHTASLAQEFEGVDLSPNKEVLMEVQEASMELATAIDNATASMQRAIKAASVRITAAETKWKKETDPQREKHARVIRDLKSEGHDPDKFIATPERLDELRARTGQRRVLAIVKRHY